MISDELTTPIATWDLLLELGFTSCVSALGSPALKYDFGNFTLQAISCDNRLFVPSVVLTGILHTERHLAHIEIQLRQIPPSMEEALSHLCREIDKYKPEVVPDWLARHRLSVQQLQEARVAAHAALPRCKVERAWARRALRPLAKQARKDNVGKALLIFLFDGELLRIQGAGNLIHMPADGVAWTQVYSIPLANLRFLIWHLPYTIPNEREQTPVEFLIRGSQIGIEGTYYDGVECWTL